MPTPPPIIGLPMQEWAKSLVNACRQVAVGAAQFSTPHMGAELLVKIRVAMMDERGFEIFDHYMKGTGQYVVFQSDKWTEYMNADSSHKQAVLAALTEYAELRGGIEGESTAAASSELRLKIKGVHVGAAGGGYSSGYAQLHGSNWFAGGFVVNARVMRTAGLSSTEHQYIFYDINYEFHDVADPNGGLPDWTAHQICTAAALKMGIGPPKAYKLTVKWPADYALKVIINDDRPNEHVFVPAGYVRSSDLSSWRRPAR